MAVKEAHKLAISLVAINSNFNLIPSVLGQVTQCKTAIEAWSKLERVYSQQSMAKILQFRQQLQSVKKGVDSISDFVLKIKNIGDALLGAGEEVNEKDLLLSLMSGVGHKYDPVVLLLTMLLPLTKETTTLEEVITMPEEEIVPEAEEAGMVIDLVRKYIVNFMLNQDIVLYNVTGGLISSSKALTIKETSQFLVLKTMHFPYHISTSHLCDSCKMGKLHTLPFSGYTITAKQPLELVYSMGTNPSSLK
ncbi:hypothetical protein ACOSQ4_005743 [Xanthoceras sorbifolium]